MVGIAGTRAYWKPSSTAGTGPVQILKNSGYISVVLHAVQYKAAGTFWQKCFGGSDKITVSTQIIWQTAADTKVAAAIQDFRKVSVPSINPLVIGRNVVLKVPAVVDGVEMQVSITAIQDDNLGRTLQFLNSDEFKQPLQLAPVAVGQVLMISALVKKVLTGSDSSAVLTASYPGIISEEETSDPVAKSRLVEGYVILIVKQDQDDRLDFDSAELSVAGNGLLVDGQVIPNTYIVYSITFDRWRGRDTTSAWSRKFDQASSKVDELLFTGVDQRQTITSASYDLLKEGAALLDADENYIPAEKRNLKKAAIQEVKDKISANVDPTIRVAGVVSHTTSSDSSGDKDLWSPEADFGDDVNSYASEIATAGLTFGFGLRSKQ